MEMRRAKGRVYAAVFAILCLLTVAGRAQTVEAVLRALQERSLYAAYASALLQMDPDTGRPTYPDDPTSIIGATPIQWPNGIQAFPGDGSITNVKDAIAALNTASRVFDVIKGRYLAYDPTKHRIPLRNEGSYPRALNIPSVGNFDENNWRIKLRQLASNVEQLRALVWPFGSTVWGGASRNDYGEGGQITRYAGLGGSVQYFKVETANGEDIRGGLGLTIATTVAPDWLSAYPGATSLDGSAVVFKQAGGPVLDEDDWLGNSNGKLFYDVLLPIVAPGTSGDLQVGVNSGIGMNGSEDISFGAAVSAVLDWLDLPAPSQNGNYYASAGIVVFVPNFDPLLPAAAKSVSAEAPALGVIEATVTNNEMLRIHLGRGNSDMNQIGWLGVEPDGFGSLLFNGSPAEFDVRYEEDLTKYEDQPLHPVTTARLYDQDEDQALQAAGFSNWEGGWGGYVTRWCLPRLKQVKGGDILAVISYNSGPYSKKIDLYWASNAGANPGPTGFYTPTGNPFKTIILENPTAASGIATEKYHLRASESGSRYYESVATQDESGHWTINFKMGSQPNGTDWQKTMVESVGKWTITESQDGLTTTTEALFANADSFFAERPEPDQVTTTRNGEQRVVSYQWLDSDLNGVQESGGAYGYDFPRVLSEMDYFGPQSWAENGKSITFDDNGLVSYSGFWFGGQWEQTVYSWNGAAQTIQTTLNGGQLPAETRTYSSLTSVSIVSAGMSPTIYNYNDGSGMAGIPGTLSLIQYPGGYEVSSSTFPNGQDMETDVSEGWGAGFSAGTVTRTRTNRYGGLVNRSVATIEGMALDSTVATSWTDFGGPKDLVHLRSETEHAGYVETGTNVGLPSSKTDRYGVQASFGYDWRGRPNSIGTGFETITPSYDNPLVSSFSSDAGYSVSRNFSVFGDLRGGSSSFGVGSSFAINPSGQSSLTVDGRTVSLGIDPTGIISSRSNGQGSRGGNFNIGIDQGLFYREVTELSKAGGGSANTVRTYFDAGGRVVKVTRPGENGAQVTETWVYNDAGRTVTYNPGAGPVAQSTTTTLSADGSVLTVQQGGKDYLQQIRSTGANGVVLTTNLSDDSGGNGAQWKEISKQTVNPSTGSTTFTPWGLTQNTIQMTDLVSQRVISGGLTNDSLTTTLAQGLPTAVSGTIDGVSVSLGVGSAVGIVNSFSGTIGGMAAGLTLDSDQRVTGITGPGSTQTVSYGGAGGGFQIAAADSAQGTSSSFSADAVGDTTAISTPHSLSLSMNTTDTGGGHQTTINGGLNVTTNLLDSVTAKNYGNGAIGESYQLNGDGSLAAFNIGGQSATFTQTPTHRTSTFADETVNEDFYDVGARKDVSASDDGRSFTYQNLELKNEQYTAGPWNGWTVERLQDGQGRLGTIQITPPSGGARQFTFGYDGHSRLNASNGLVNATYGNRDAAGRLTSLTRGSLATSWIFNGTSGLLQSVTHTGAGTFTYGFPSYDQRRRITQRTANPGVAWGSMTYGGASQLTGAVVTSSSRPLSYTYDGRGNRSGGNGFTQTPNGLDQITGRTLSNRGFGLFGSVNPTAQVSALTPLSPNWQSLPVTPVTGEFSGYWDVSTSYNGGAAALMNVTVRGTLPGGGTNGAAAVADSNLNLLVPPSSETLAYDGAGRLASDAFWIYTWNVQGRPLQMVRKAGTWTEVGANGERLNFSYDADGRRTRKTHTVNYADGHTKVEYSQVLWSGWLPVMEDRTLNGTSLGRRWFQWGVDRSGSLEGAGGVGGLVAIYEESGRTLLPVEDGLGNIMAVVNAGNGQTVARYDHGPFGEPLGESGEVDACPFRYQTKWYDKECQHYYFGYRHYDPRMGRWLSRDQIGEAGGFNLYAYCGNDPVNRHDPNGNAPISQCAPTDGKVAEDILAIKGFLEQRHTDALRRNEQDAVGWRPAKFVNWGTADEWGSLAFLQRVQKARKELGPNGYGTYQTSNVLYRNFGDINEDVLRYFEPKGGYATSANMRANFDLMGNTAVAFVTAGTMMLDAPEELLITGFASRGAKALSTRSFVDVRNLVNAGKLNVSSETVELLNQLRRSGSSIEVPSTFNLQTLSELQRSAQVEFGLFEMGDKQMLVRGTRFSVSIPKQATGVIAHSHPGQSIFAIRPSIDDISALENFGQSSSIIVNEGGVATEFTNSRRSLLRLWSVGN